MVEEVTGTTACGGTDTERVTKTELVELILVVEVLVVIGLVGYEDNR